MDVRGVFAAAAAAEDVVGLGGLAGVFGVRVEGTSCAGTRKRGGIATASERVFSESDSVSVDSDEKAFTRLGAPLSPAPDGPG